MSSLFLFGAGASYGSGNCLPYPPPLGSQFFAALRDHGSPATVVSDELAALFIEDFEAGMDRYAKDHPVRLSRLLRDMAHYFVQFVPGNGNYYFELIKMLATAGNAFVLATTNYDLLIEHAIVRNGLFISYYGLPVKPKNVALLKIHGSCNFLPDMNGTRITGIGFDLSSAENSYVLNAGVKVATSPKEVFDFCANEDSIAPALALYEPSKRVLYCRDFIEFQQAEFQKAITAADRIYIVGLRVHPVDVHIWKPLAEARSEIYYVGFEPEEFTAWLEAAGRGNGFVLARSFKEALAGIREHLEV